MRVVTWQKDESVGIITMKNGENRHNPDFSREFMSCYNEILSNEEILSIVITSDDEKFFSLGIDLNWMLPLQKNGDYETISQWMLEMNDVLKAVIMAPVPTIAAITGHAFGNGFLLAMACDFRIMNGEKGFACLPEVDLSIQFTPSMLQFLRKSAPYHFILDMMFSGERFSAEELLIQGVIKKVSSNRQNTLEESITFAKRFKKQRKNMKEIKNRLYKHISDAMDNEDYEYLKADTSREPAMFMFTP